MTEHTTTYSLLDEVANRMSQYPKDDYEAAEQAWKDLGVALAVLLFTLEEDDVRKGVMKTYGVAALLADHMEVMVGQNG